MKFKCLSAVVLSCMLFMLVSCKSVMIGSSGRRHKHGPPPHAPAHGYRHKYQGVELVFDSGRGVYVVVEIPNHYYFKGRYYRHSGGQWEMGVSIDGEWEFVSEESLPWGLQTKDKGKGKAKGKQKEHPGRGLGLEKNK